MKLHLPKPLRNSVLACIAAVAGVATTTVGTATFTGGVVALALSSQQVSAINIADAQEWTQNSTEDLGIITVDGGSAHLIISGGTHSTTEKLELKNGGDLTMTGGSLTVDFVQLHNARAVTEEVLLISGGTLNVTSTKTTTETTSAVVLGHWPDGSAPATLRVTNSGILNAKDGAVVIGWDTQGMLDVAGGTVNARKVVLNGNRQGGNLNLNGGRLNVGVDGIVVDGSGGTRNANLLSGTLGALSGEGWTLNTNNMNCTLGNLTIDTTVVDGTTGANITILGKTQAADTGTVITLQGNGSLTYNSMINGTVNLAAGSDAKVYIDLSNKDNFLYETAGGSGSAGLSGVSSGVIVFDAASTARVYDSNNVEITITEGEYADADNAIFVVKDAVEYGSSDIPDTVTKYALREGGNLVVKDTSAWNADILAQGGGVTIDSGASYDLSTSTDAFMNYLCNGSKVAKFSLDKIVIADGTSILHSSTDGGKWEWIQAAKILQIDAGAHLDMSASYNFGPSQSSPLVVIAGAGKADAEAGTSAASAIAFLAQQNGKTSFRNLELAGNATVFVKDGIKGAVTDSYKGNNHILTKTGSGTLEFQCDIDGDITMTNGRLELNKGGIRSTGAAATYQGITGTLTIDKTGGGETIVYNNEEGESMHRSFNSIDIKKDNTLVLDARTWNTIWEINSLSGSGDLTWKNSTSHNYTSRMILSGDNTAYTGDITLQRTGGAIRAYVELASDKAAAGSVISLQGISGSRAMLAVNTDSASIKGLNGSTYATVYAGAAVAERDTAPVSNRANTVLIISGNDEYEFAGTVGSNADTEKLSIKMTGTGIQKFTGAIYAKDITVEGGTLVLGAEPVADTISVGAAGKLKFANTLTLGDAFKGIKVANGGVLDVSDVTSLNYDDFKAWKSLSDGKVQEDGTIQVRYELECDFALQGVSTLKVLDSNLTVDTDTTQCKLTYDAVVSAEVVATWDSNWGAELVKAPESLTTVKISEMTGSVHDGLTYYRIDATYTAGETVGVVLDDAKATSGWVVGGNDTNADGEVGLVERDVWIQAKTGTYDGIVGGNHAQAWGGGASADFVGNTHILVDGATVGHIIGGTLKDGRSPVFTGNSYISIKSGEVTGSIVGAGSNTHNGNNTFNGNTNIYVYVPLTTPETQGDLFNAGKGYIAGGSVKTANSGGTSILNGNAKILIDLSSYDGQADLFDKAIIGAHRSSFYGGEYTVNGSTTVDIKAGSIDFTGLIVGGSYSGDTANLTHTGNTSVKIQAGSGSTLSGDIVGGTYDAKWGRSAAITGNTQLQIELEAGAVSTGMIVGGSVSDAWYSDASSLVLTGTSKVELKGAAAPTINDTPGKYAGTVVAGMHIKRDRGDTATIGSTELIIDGGLFTGDVIGSSHVQAGYVTMTGTASVSISGATLTGTLYGGNYYSSDGGAAVDSTVGNVTITIDKESVVADVIGGSASKITANTAGTQIMNTGDVVINVNKARLTGDVYAAGWQVGSAAMTTASTTINLSSDATIEKQNAVISGGYKGGTDSTVTGEQVLNLTGTGTRDITNLTIRDFDNINVKGGTLVVGADKTLSGVSGLTFEKNSSLKLWDGTADGTNSVLTLDAAALTLLPTTQSGVSLLADSTLGDLTVKLPEDWATEDTTTDITLVNGLSAFSLNGASVSGRVKASTVFSTLNGASFDSYKETYYLMLDQDGNLKLVNGSVGASDFYWRGDNNSTWSSENWAYEKDGTEKIYIQNVPHKTAVNAIFDKAGSSYTVAVDTNAIVDTVLVTNGSYTFQQTAVQKMDADGKPVVDADNNPVYDYLGSLEIKDELNIGKNGTATLDMADKLKVKDIVLSDATSTLVVKSNPNFITVEKEVDGKKVTETGHIIATNGGTITNALPAGNNSTLVLVGAELGGVATIENGTVVGNGVKLDGTSFKLQNSTLTGQIDNAGAYVTLSGNIHLATDKMGNLLEGKTITYKDENGNVTGTWDLASDNQVGICNGYTIDGMSAKLFTFGGVMTDMPDGNTWTMVDGNGKTIEATVVSLDGMTYSIQGMNMGTEYVAGDKKTAVEYDATDSLFSNRATALVLNGGNIVLKSGLDKSENSKLTDGIRAEQDGSVTINSGVTLAQADLNANGKNVTLLGGGTYDLGTGTALSTGVLLGVDNPDTATVQEPEWIGTVKTAATAISDLSGLGTAKSSVELTEAVTMTSNVSAGAVKTVAFDKGLTLGDAGTAGTLTANELNLGSLTIANLGSAVTAGSLTNDKLAISIDKSVLGGLTAGATRSLVELSSDTSLATLTFNGETDCTFEETGAKYFYTIGWEQQEKTVDNKQVQVDAVVLSTTLNENYVKENYAAIEPNAQAGATLLDGTIVELDPQTNRDEYSTLAGLLDSVDAGSMSEDTLANLAGASTAVLGMAAVGDVDRQLRAIRNRTTTMGVDQTVVNHDMPYFNAWINAEGDQREMKADGTLGGYKLNSWGGTVGFDVDIAPTFTAGLALTAMYGDLDATGADKATGNMDTYYVSAFARYCDSAWTHTFVATAGMGDISLDRTVLGHELKGETESMSFGFMYEVGRVFALDEDATACIQPVFNVTWRHASVDGYTEKGSDAALEVGDQTLDTVTFGLGARLQAVVGESMYNRTSIFECRVLAKADVGDRCGSADVALASLPGSKASVDSAETGAFGLEAGAGLTIPLGDEGSSIFMDASVELRADYTNVNGTVGYRINF